MNSAADSIRFSGREWVVKHGSSMGPGPNRWSKELVWVDEHGLHLCIRRDARGWACAEVRTATAHGYGRYEVALVGSPDRFDPNIVFGMFTYPGPGQGSDGTQEIDIEFSRWGRQERDVGNYTVWPPRAGYRRSGHTFPVTLSGTHTRHAFEWNPRQVSFESRHSHARQGPSIQRWRFTPPGNSAAIPTPPLHFHLNLWPVAGHPPLDGRSVEIVIQRRTHGEDEHPPTRRRVHRQRRAALRGLGLGPGAR